MFPTEASKGLQYNYAHIALPILVLMNPKKFYQDVTGRKGDKYLKTIWQGLAGKMGVRQSPNELGLSKQVIGDDVEAFVIRLPKPIESPEAFFVAAVFRVKKQFLSKEIESARYFTLELGRNIFDQSDEYHFYEWVGNVLRGQQHKNYGQTADYKEETFIAAINDVM